MTNYYVAIVPRNDEAAESVGIDTSVLDVILVHDAQSETDARIKAQHAWLRIGHNPLQLSYVTPIATEMPPQTFTWTSVTADVEGMMQDATQPATDA